jgi:hypothetical protein
MSRTAAISSSGGPAGTGVRIRGLGGNSSVLTRRLVPKIARDAQAGGRKADAYPASARLATAASISWRMRPLPTETTRQ